MMECRYSLEKHLEQCSRYDDQFTLLHNSLAFNKKQIAEVLESIKLHFPHYSKHGFAHSICIITSIELVLGEERIKSLGATDTYLILMSAYLHDIGMYLTNNEIRTTWAKPEFAQFLADYSEYDESARFVKGVLDGTSDAEWSHSRILDLTEHAQMVTAEYFRRIHGEKGAERIVKNLRELDILLNTKNSIPRRLVSLLANLCASHNHELEEVMNLPQEQSSSLGDIIHPRFIAILLRVGDLLDLDNNRFDELAILSCFSKLNAVSQTHFDKHNSIEQLLITPEKIEIASISDNIEVLDESRRWLNMLEKEVANLRDRWYEIVPAGLPGTAPKVKFVVKNPNSERPFEDRNLKLEFPAEKAFQLISGENIYQDKFTFLRELVQNSLDAVKIQFWRDLNKGNILTSGLPAHFLLPSSIKKREFGKYETRLFFYDGNKEDDRDVLIEHIGPRALELLNNKSTAQSLENKLVIVVEDNGIGISLEDLEKRLLKSGGKKDDKKDERNKEIQSMPSWLKPTGGFGIGLHSVFTVTDHIVIQTKSEQDLAHGRQIYIQSGMKKGFVTSDRWDMTKGEYGRKMLRGTRLILLIENKEQLLHTNRELILDQDYFEEDSVDFTIKYMSELIAKEIPMTESYSTRATIGFRYHPAEIDEKNYKPHPMKDGKYQVTLFESNKLVEIIEVYDTEKGHRLWLFPAANFGEHSGVKLTFKGVNVGDSELIKELVPLLLTGDKLHVDYAFENTSDYLHVNRSSFLQEKRRPIKEMTADLFRAAIAAHNDYLKKAFRNEQVSFQAYNELNTDIMRVLRQAYASLLQQNENTMMGFLDGLSLFIVELKEQLNEGKIVPQAIPGLSREVCCIIFAKRAFNWLHILKGTYNFEYFMKEEYEEGIHSFINKIVSLINECYADEKDGVLTNKNFRRYLDDLRGAIGGYSLDVLPHRLISFNQRIVSDRNRIYSRATHALKLYLYNMKLSHSALADEELKVIMGVLADYYIHDDNYGHYSDAWSNEVAAPLLFAKCGQDEVRRIFFGSEAILDEHPIYFPIEHRHGQMYPLKPIRQLSVIPGQKARYLSYVPAISLVDNWPIATTDEAKKYLFSELAKVDYIDVEAQDWVAFPDKYYIIPALEEYGALAIPTLPIELQFLFDRSIGSRFGNNGFIVIPFKQQEMNGLIEAVKEIAYHYDPELRKKILDAVDKGKWASVKTVIHDYHLEQALKISDIRAGGYAFDKMVKFAVGRNGNDELTVTQVYEKLKDDILIYMFKTMM